MRAAVLETRGREGLKYRDFADPTPGPDDIVLRIHSVGLNRVDLYMRDSGVGITHQLPLIQGVEGAGVVAHAPAGSSMKVGQKAIMFSNAFCGKCRYCMAGDQTLCVKSNIQGEHRHGTLAEYFVTPAYCVLPLPDDADLLGAGALMVGHLTAWRMLFGKARPLTAGETVLIVGIGGGVAVATLQLALMAGARVLVTSSSDEKIARAVAMGATAGVNYRTEKKVYERVLALTGGEGVDMVIDSVGASSWGDSLRSLRRGGRLVTCGATTGSNPGADLQRMFIRQLEVYGSTGGSMEELRQLLQLFGRGGAAPVIDKVYPLAQVNDAFDRLSAGEQFGKVVVSID